MILHTENSKESTKKNLAELTVPQGGRIQDDMQKSITGLYISNEQSKIKSLCFTSNLS